MYIFFDIDIFISKFISLFLGWHGCSVGYKCLMGGVCLLLVLMHLERVQLMNSSTFECCNQDF